MAARSLFAVALAACSLAACSLAACETTREEIAAPSDSGAGEVDASTPDQPSPRDAGAVDGAATCAAFRAQPFEPTTGAGAYPGAYVAGIAPTNNGTRDQIILEFTTDATGTFDLSQPPNDDYGTCEQCVTLYLGDHVLRPARGVLEIASGTSPLEGHLRGTLRDVHFVEVHVTSDPLSSVVIEGGVCGDLEAPATLVVGPTRADP